MSVAAVNPFAPYKPPPGVVPEGDPILAMDDASYGAQAWARSNQINIASAEGQLFVGFPTLAILSQRAEYRIISEVMATEMVRKWITLKALDGSDKTERIKKIEQEFTRLGVRECFRQIAEQDGFYGRAHLFLDFGNTDDREELKTDIGDGSNDEISKSKIKKDSLKAIRVIEAVWIYPQDYNAQFPLQPDWYKPRGWYVMGQMVHVTRLLTFIGREMPDLLKPSYAFAGLSLTQMAIPYVTNWLDIRTAVTAIVKAFSVFVLSTNATDVLAGGQGATFLRRLDVFNAIRDNRGVMAIDKDKEDFKNVSAPIGGLDQLQAQSQEHMAAVSRIPLVKLLGISPSGLNACVPADTLILTNRGQIAIRDVTLSDQVWTRRGFAPLTFSGVTKYATDLIEITTLSRTIRCTPNHPIWLPSINEFVAAENVRLGDRLLLIGDTPVTRNTRRPSRGAAYGGGEQPMAITQLTMPKESVGFFYIERCGNIITDLSRMVFISTILTKIKSIIKSETLKRCMEVSMPDFIISTLMFRQFEQNQKQLFVSNAEFHSSSKFCQVGKRFAAVNASLLIGEQLSHPKQNPSRPASASCAKRRLFRLVKTQSSVLENVRQLVRIAQDTCAHIFSRTPKSLSLTSEINDEQPRGAFQKNALDAASILCRPDESMNCFAPMLAKGEPTLGVLENVLSVRKIPTNEPVYDLTVAHGHLPEFVANGILVHNSSEGELQVFSDHISATQEAFFRPNLTTVLRIVQLNLFGDVDHQIGFDFGELVELTLQEEADLRKVNAETGEILVRAKAVSSSEERLRVIKDTDGPYQDLDAKKEVEFPMTENEKADVSAKIATTAATLVAEGIIGIPIALKEIQAQSDITGFGLFIDEDVIAKAEETEADAPDPNELALMAANGGEAVGGKPGVDPALAKVGEPGKAAPTAAGARPKAATRPIRPTSSVGSKPIA